MPESGFAGASSSSSVSPGSSVTYYGNFGNSAAATVGAFTTEAEAELIHRGSNVTLKNLRVVVVTNARAATSSVTTRKNSADTSQVATITASTTGTYTDLSNTVSVAATDKVAYKLIIGSTSGAFLVSSITVDHESASQAFNFWSSLGPASTATASVTRYWNVLGSLTVQATEANVQTYAPAAGSFSNLRAYVTAARATNTTLKSRVGAVDGAMSVTLTASTTGAFEDTTNSDTVSAGNLFCAATVTGTGADTLTVSNVSVRFVPSTAFVTGIGSGSTSANLTAGVTRFFAPIGAMGALSAEATAQQIAPCAGTASYLATNITANASTTTSTFVLRDNGVSTSLSFTVAGGATGTFADTSNSHSVAVADLLAVQGSGADGTVTLRSLTMRFTAAAGPITGTASITEAGDTLSSASALALKGVLAVTEAGDTLSSAATLALKAAAAITEEDDTLAATGGLVIVGALSATEEDDTLSAFMGRPIAGEASITEAGDTLSAMARALFWSPIARTSETWTQLS